MIMKPYQLKEKPRNKLLLKKQKELHQLLVDQVHLLLLREKDTIMVQVAILMVQRRLQAEKESMVMVNMLK